MIRGQLQMKATSLHGGTTCQSAAKGEPKQQNGVQIEIWPVDACLLNLGFQPEPFAAPSLPPANAPFGWSFPERGCAANVKSHDSRVSVPEVVAPQNFIEPSLAITLGPSSSIPLEVFKECG